MHFNFLIYMEKKLYQTFNTSKSKSKIFSLFDSTQNLCINSTIYVKSKQTNHIQKNSIFPIKTILNQIFKASKNTKTHSQCESKYKHFYTHMTFVYSRLSLVWRLTLTKI